jgi:predicted NAD/FAD-binding protein
MRVEVLPDAPVAQGALTADTVIVDSGVAGLSAAYELTSAGRKVIVVDHGSIAGGMTSRTTAHLAPICDDAISSLIDLCGDDMARQFQKSQETAVDRVEAIVDDGDRLFADSPVVRVEASPQGVEVHLQNGARVSAAMPSSLPTRPSTKRGELHSKMAPYRTYAMAFAIARDVLPDALYRDIADPYPLRPR